MATVEQVLETATEFMLKSPPGELKEVVHDIRRLISDESILNSTIGATFREYNTDQMIQVPFQDHVMLVTKEGEISEGQYMNPRAGQVVFFDHITQQITGSRPFSGEEVDREVEPYRKAFEAAVGEYIAEHYLNGTATVYGSRNNQKAEITVCISSSKFSPSNYWNGRWRSKWHCDFQIGSTKVDLEGLLKVDVHYYEDGNVQLNTEAMKAGFVTAESSRPEAMADVAIKAIGDLEALYQSDLEDNYHAMDGTTFKALRRILPITRNKVDWEKIHGYRLGVDITEYTKD